MPNTGFYSNNLTTLRRSSCLSLFDNERYDFELTSDHSSLIAKHLPQLKILSIGDCGVLKDGVRIILCECKNLWRLSMAHCQGVWLLSKKHERRIEASSKIISVKMEKKLEGTGNIIRLYIDSVERVFNSSEEVLDKLFGSI
ncbi:LRR domain containing protein [Parasponia andersonii]|uniref:LRR domain containing protein n=1 Tax=Parasponia andersonii TaxID=3476 RepID=A0A2P5AUE6_PARAD|nr:LRR domain containing protein [Parasponia andersonii]